MRELTFNITEDKRYLVEPTNVENFNLTFDKPNWVQGRVGEDSLRQVFVNVVTGPNNEPYDLTGINPEFDGLTAKGGPEHRNYVIIDNHHSVMIDAQGGRFRFDFPKEAFAIAGSYKQAFFSLKREGTGEVVATLEFDMKVMANFVYETVKAVDYITPFDDVLDQLLEKYKQGNADREEQFNQFITNIQTQYNSIKSQFEASEALADALDERLKALETKIQQDGLFTQAEAEQWQESIQKILTSINGVNVMQFGAVADGQHDNVLAIANAIQYAKDNGINAIYFPAGKYYTTGHDVVLAGMKVSGVGRDQSILIKDISEPFFELRTDSRVTGLRFYDKSTNQSSILKVNNNDGISSSWNIEIDNCWLMGDEAQGNVHATWNTTAINFDLNGKGLWDVHLHDNIIYWVDYGVKVDTTNNGWFTGSVFHDLTIKGFSVAAMALMSSNNTARQISHNSISDIVVETLYKDSGNNTAIGYILSGTLNTFSNLMLFRDGAYSGKALQLRSFASTDFLKKYPGTGTGSSANNLFIGGALEGKIDDPDDLFELQTFINVSLQEERPGDGWFPTRVNSEKKNNFVSLDMMRGGLDYTSQITNEGKSQMTSGFDEFGKYLQIDASNQGAFASIPFLAPLETYYGINKSPKFSVGIKYRNMNDDNDTPIGYVTLRFAEEEFPQTNRIEWFENERVDKKLTEHVEIYNNDNAYWTRYSAKNPKFDAVFIRIRPNRSVRIYDSMLVEGQAIDFSKIVRESPINVNVDGGGNNYILNSDKALGTATKKTLTTAQNIPFQVDAGAINWNKTSPMVLSFDLNAGNLDTTGVTGRLAIYLGLTINFDDGTSAYYYSGIVSGLTAPIVRARIPGVFTVPNKTVTSASAILSIQSGVSFDYITVQRPQLESGTVAHAYSSYVQTTTDQTEI